MGIWDFAASSSAETCSHECGNRASYLSEKIRWTEPALTYDDKTKRFVGPNTDKANKYIACSYREPFVMPQNV